MKLKKSILIVLLPVTILVLGLLILNTPLLENPFYRNQQNTSTVNDAPSGTIAPTNPPAIKEPAFEFGTLAFEHLTALENIGPRVAGSNQERIAGDYIYSVFQSIGYTPVIQQFSAWDEYGTKYQSANIIATNAG